MRNGTPRAEADRPPASDVYYILGVPVFRGVVTWLVAVPEFRSQILFIGKN